MKHPMKIRSFLLVAFLLSPVLAFAQGLTSERPIVADDGRPVANHTVPAQYRGAAEKMPGAVVVGNPLGDVTLVEFYDLNCPYCRRASADLDAMLEKDKGLRLVLVPYPVLGVASILAGRVELAVAKTSSPEVFYKFHRQVYAGRGVIDGQRALATARALNLDESRLVMLADDDQITDIMKSHVRLGDALKLMATPSYVVGNSAIVGHPGRKALEKIVASVRRCGAVTC